MKHIILISLIALFLLGCTGEHQTHIAHEDHLGCSEDEIVDGECVAAEKGQRNVDLFDSLESIDVLTENVIYSEGVSGFLAQPKTAGPHPGVIMIHEWWGLNENIKDMARLLANEGYVVLAVDLYDGQVSDGDSGLARELVTAVRENPDAAVANMQDAAAYLRELPSVQSDSLASMGWCFGGQQSLNLALADEDLAATVIYYGHLTDDTQALAVIDQPILGIFGETDTGIPPETVREFEAALNELSIENDIHIYDGVGHAFANPTGSRYAPEETVDAWTKTVDFLDKNLK